MQCVDPKAKIIRYNLHTFAKATKNGHALTNVYPPIAGVTANHGTITVLIVVHLQTHGAEIAFAEVLRAVHAQGLKELSISKLQKWDMSIYPIEIHLE